MLSSDSTGYDIFTSIFSPEGRIYQVEYASKANLLSGTAIGLRGSDGIVMASANLTASPLYETGGNARTFTIDEHIGAVVAGFLPDARAIVEIARNEASEFKRGFESSAPLNFIKQNVASHVHTLTLYNCFRPFGASVILGAYKPDGPQLYCIQPSGAVAGYFGCAIGKAANAARSEMENIDIINTPVRQLVKDAARIIYAVHEEERSSPNFELELSWAGEITNGRHISVPPRVRKGAEDYAEEMLAEEESSDSE